MIIAKTVKGKGVSFMENTSAWHGKAPNKDQYEAARTELLAAQAKWRAAFAGEPQWQGPRPEAVQLQSGGAAKIADDGAVFVDRARAAGAAVISGESPPAGGEWGSGDGRAARVGRTG